MAPSRPRTSRRSEQTGGNPGKSANPSGAARGRVARSARDMRDRRAARRARPGTARRAARRAPRVRARRDGHARLRRRRARAGDRDDRARHQSQFHLRRPRARARDDRLARADPRGAGLRGIRVGAPGEGLHHGHDARRRDQGGARARGEGIEHRDGAELEAPAEPRHVRHAADPAALHRRRLDREHTQAAGLEGRGDGRLSADQHGDPDRVVLEHPAPDPDPRIDRRRDLQGRPRRHQRRVRRRHDARRSDLGDLRRRGGRDRRRVRLAPRRPPTGGQSERTERSRTQRAQAAGADPDRRPHQLAARARAARAARRGAPPGREARRAGAGRRADPRLLPEQREGRGPRPDALGPRRGGWWRRR